MPSFASSGLYYESDILTGSCRTHLSDIVSPHTSAKKNARFKIGSAKINEDRPGIFFSHGRRIPDLRSCDAHRPGRFIDPYIQTCCCFSRIAFAAAAAGDHQYKQQCKQQRFLFHIIPLKIRQINGPFYGHYTSLVSQARSTFKRRRSSICYNNSRSKDNLYPYLK